jgi:hypothetical protein
MQLTLDPLLTSTDDTGVIVNAESMFGDFRIALKHLNERKIDTRRPDEIRGGGLLKYWYVYNNDNVTSIQYFSHLLARGFRPARPWRCRQLEKYMCSRFFIDFPDVASQEQKLLGYIEGHMVCGAKNKNKYLK